jgi:hypothetical protein
MTSTAPRRWRVVLGTCCDVVFVILVVLAIWAHVFGGFRVGHGIFAISTRSVARLLFQAAALSVLRHLILPAPSHRSYIARWLHARPLNLSPLPMREWFVATALYVPLVVVYLWPQVSMPGGLPDRGDPLFSVWTLSHIADTLFQGGSVFFDGRIFYPAPNTFLWSDLTILPGVIAAPWIWLGVPVAYVYTSIITGASLLSCVAMYGLVRRTTAVPVAAFVAGALFGFLPYRFAQYSHLQMQGIFLMPLAVMALLSVLESPRWTRGLLVGLLVALQTLWSTYCGAYLTVGLAAVTLGWWLTGREISRRHLAAGVLAVGLCSVMMAPYVAAYARARNVVSVRPRTEVAHYGAHLADYLSPNGNHAWYGQWAPVHTKSEERHLLPGAGPVLLGIGGLLTMPTSLTVAAATGLLVSLDGSLGLSSFTYSFFYDYVPLLRTFRVPARFGLLVGVFLTWAAGMGAARLWRWSESRTPLRVLVGLLFVAAVVEARPTLTLHATPTDVPAIYASLPTDRRAVVLELPVPGQGAEAYWVDPSYLYFATFHKHTLVNGYSGYYPEWYGNLSWASSALPAADAMEAIRTRGAEFIVVHEEHYGAERYREVVAGLAQQPDLTSVATVKTPQGEDRLFVVRRD